MTRCLGLLSLLPVSLAAQQTVGITAPTATATEAGVYSGLLRLSRTGDTTTPLTVTLSWSGTATPGQDYAAMPDTVNFPAGAATVDLTLDPINDAIVEADPGESVIATLQPGDGYSVGAPASATITIADDDTLSQTAPLLSVVERDTATSVRLRWLDLFETETKFRVQYRAAGTTSWTTIDNLPPNTTTRVVTNLVTGQLYEFRVDAYQGTTASKTINAVLGVPLPPNAAAPAYSTFEQWRLSRGLSGALRYTAGGTAQDPDGDGRPNLLEYALGGDPLTPDSQGLVLGPGVGGLALSWPEVSGLLDVDVSLEESTSLDSWSSAPLASSLANGVRSALDARGGDRRFYRLHAAPAVAAAPSARIICWGDSLTGNPGTYVEKLPALLPGNRTVLNCGIGGDISTQVADRMRGLQITAPYPAFAAATPAGTPLRIVASRTTHARNMSTAYRSSWASYSATIANVAKVEFFNLGSKIGETSTPLAASVTSNRATNSSRLLSPGHPFADGDVVHFPSGPLPSPLVVGKTYYVRDADSGGFRLVESDVTATITASISAPSTRFVSANHPFVDGDAVWFRPGAAPAGLFSDRLYYVRDADSGGYALADAPGAAAISVSYTSTLPVMGKPGLTPVTLATDFTASTRIQGPFVLDWTHPGGATSLSLRTRTDRDTDTFIFWMGRNNNTRPHEIFADLRAAVDHIKALDARFLIVSVTNGAGESLGSPYYYGTLNLNHLLRREYPDNFVDIRSALLRAASSSTADQTDRAADIPPSSLRGDSVHFNDAGQTLIANILAAELIRRGW